MPAPAWEPTPEEVQTILSSRSVSEAAQAVGRDWRTIDRWLRRQGRRLGTQAPLDDPQPEVASEPEPVLDLGAMAFESSIWLAFERVQAEMDALETEEDEVSVALPDTEPVLVVYLSDLHIGHRQCDMRALRHDLEAIRNTPGVYAILGGDLIDNVIATKAGRGSYHEQLAAIRAQRRMVDEAVDYLGPNKVLAMVRGNHEAWTLADADYDPVAYFASRVNCAFLGDTGFVNLSLGEQTYRILASHAFRMRSSFNATHQAKRLEDFWGDADVVFTGHTHDAAAEETHRRRARHFYGQAGSYLRTSRYSRSLGFPDSSPDMPGALLFPDQHEIIGMARGLSAGIHLLRSFRSERGPCVCRFCQPARE